MWIMPYILVNILVKMQIKRERHNYVKFIWQLRLFMSDTTELWVQWKYEAGVYICAYIKDVLCHIHMWKVYILIPTAQKIFKVFLHFLVPCQKLVDICIFFKLKSWLFLCKLLYHIFIIVSTNNYKRYRLSTGNLFPSVVCKNSMYYEKHTRMKHST